MTGGQVYVLFETVAHLSRNTVSGAHFVQKDFVGDSITSFAEIQKDCIYQLSYISSVGYTVIVGDHVQQADHVQL